MTTHYEKLYVFGKKLVDNLVTSGVSASFNDGALTLADKILDISRFPDIVLLYGTKDIVQAGESCSLYGMALNDGAVCESGSVYFVQKSKHLLTDKGTSAKNSDWYDNNLSTDIFERKTDYTQLKYSASKNRIQLIPSITANKVYFKFKTYESNLTDDFVIIQFQNGQTAKSFGSLSISANSVVEIELNGNKMNAWVNGVQTLTNNTLYGNISEDDFNIRFGLNPNSDGIKVSDVIVDVEDLLLDSATTSNGVATNTVTGTGYGRITSVAKFNDLESNEYEFLDALFKDMGTSTDYGSWSDWGSQQEYKPKITRDTYCKIEVDAGKSGARIYKTIDTSNGDMVIEFDVKQVTSSASNVWATLRNNSVAVLGNVDMSRFSSYGGAINEWVHFKFVVTPTNVKVYVNNNTSAYTYNASGVTRFYFQIDSSTSELDYKNFVIYKPSRVEPTNVALTGSSSIIQTGDTLTLSAKATSSETGVCTGNRIDFIQKHKQLFKDNGINQVSTDWIKDSQLNASADGTGTTISETNGTSRYLRANIGSTSDYNDFIPPYTIECDIVSYTKTGTSVPTLMCWNSGRNANKNMEALGITGNNHIKIDVGTDRVKYYRDGVDLGIDVVNTNTSASTVGFIINNGSVKFKNYKILKDTQIGSALTDETSTATLTYTGVGQGDVDFKAKYQSIETTELDVIDAVIYDDFETSYNGILNYNGSDASIEISSDWHKTGSKSAKCTMNNTYVGYGANSPSQFIGETIHYQLDCKATTTGTFVILINQNSEWIYAQTTNIAIGENHLSGSYDIPSGADGFRLRFLSFGTGTVYIDNWAIW